MRKLYFTLVVSEEELADKNQHVVIQLENSKIFAPVVKVEFDELADSKIMELVHQMYKVE
jgi:hypothetical protein